MAESPYLADVRRAGIKLIYAKRFESNGGKAAFALAVQRSPSQVGHWFSGHRNPNGDTCREIERLLGLPRDWLDQAHGADETLPAKPTGSAIALTDALPVTLEALRQAPQESRAELAQVLGLLVTTGSELYAKRVGDLLSGVTPHVAHAEEQEATEADWRDLRKRAMRIAETDKSPAKRAMAAKLMNELDQAMRVDATTSKPRKTRQVR